MDRLCPTVKEKHKDKQTWAIIEYEVPLYVRYNEMMTELQDPEAGKNTRAVKEKLFGIDLPLTTPDVYQEIGMLRELGLLAVWDDFEVHRQAQIIAQYRLDKMESTYRRYLEILDEGKKSHQREVDDRNKPRRTRGRH